MKPKKSLGQNFLVNKSIAYKICEAGEVMPEDVVLEIGPGKGFLTEVLLEKAGKVVVVEKDDRAIPLLQEKFANQISEGKLEIIHGDILEMQFDDKFIDRGYKLIANIPYYITGEILKRFLSHTPQPKLMVLMMQKEVVDRILARDGKESLLSISVKVFGTPKLIQKVDAGNFYPRPNVDSAVMLIKNISKDFFNDINEEEFFDLVRMGFAHKRKFLSSNLKQLKATPDKMKKSGIFSNIRAEKLQKDQWKKLYKELER